MSTQLATREEMRLGQPEEVSGLVRLAVEQNVPVEALEKLVALQERVTERNAAAAFVEALTAFREECPPIPKTRENTQFSVTRNGIKRASKYAPLEVIDPVARPVAAKHGLVWTWDTEIRENMMDVTCKVLHVFGHSETSTVSMPYESKAGASPQQKFGSTQTYGMRYSLIAALGLTMADEDVDGQAANDPGETITDEQAADLHALIEETGSDLGRFLAFYDIASLDEMPVARHDDAIRRLEKKREVAS